MRKTPKYFLIAAIILTIITSLIIPILTQIFPSLTLKQGIQGILFTIIVTPALGFIAFVLFIVAIILYAHEKSKNNKQSIDNIAENVKNTIDSEKENNKPMTVCKYCGTVFAKNSERCPNCGATNQQ